MPRSIATNTIVDLKNCCDFVRPRHQMILATRRRDGAPQLSPVTGGVRRGRIVISSYPERAKLHNLAPPGASVLVLSDEFNGAWVQVDGPAEVLDMPVPRGRGRAGRVLPLHQRRAFRLGRVPRGDARPGQVADPRHAQRWGPIATGGFPPGSPTDGWLGPAADRGGA